MWYLGERKVNTPMWDEKYDEVGIDLLLTNRN